MVPNLELVLVLVGEGEGPPVEEGQHPLLQGVDGRLLLNSKPTFTSNFIPHRRGSTEGEGDITQFHKENYYFLWWVDTGVLGSLPENLRT